MATESGNQPEQVFDLARSGEVPTLYLNGFQSGIGNADVTIIAQQNGHPVAFLNMSYTLAKTLSVSLGNLISRLEEVTGNEIMTTHMIDARMGQEGKADEKSDPDEGSK